MLSKKDILVVKKILGEDIFQILEKSEIGGGLYKPDTKTALDPEEIKIALEIVPRTILSYLMSKLKDKQVGEVCKCELPFAEGATLECNKLGPDNYSGQIIQGGKVCAVFKHRSLPGIGLVILTTFELYDMANLDKEKASESEEKVEKLQRIIDQRLELLNFVQGVVDKRITEKQAIDAMVRARLNDHIEQRQRPEENQEKEDMMDKKGKLKQFLEAREKKRQEPVELEKGEIKCPDCESTLYKKEDTSIKLCICYGEFHNKNIKLQKSSNGKIRLKFPKSFNTDNVEMLLQGIKENKND